MRVARSVIGVIVAGGLNGDGGSVIGVIVADGLNEGGAFCDRSYCSRWIE